MVAIYYKALTFWNVKNFEMYILLSFMAVREGKITLNSRGENLTPNFSELQYNNFYFIYCKTYAGFSKSNIHNYTSIKRWICICAYLNIDLAVCLQSKNITNDNDYAQMLKAEKSPNGNKITYIMYATILMHVNLTRRVGLFTLNYSIYICKTLQRPIYHATFIFQYEYVALAISYATYFSPCALRHLATTVMGQLEMI